MQYINHGFWKLRKKENKIYVDNFILVSKNEESLQ